MGCIGIICVGDVYMNTRHTMNGEVLVLDNASERNPRLELTQTAINILFCIVLAEATMLVYQHWDTFSPFAHMAINTISDIAGTIVEGGKGVLQYARGDLNVQADLVEVGVSASQNGTPQKLYLRPEVAAPIQQTLLDIIGAFK